MSVVAQPTTTPRAALRIGRRGGGATLARAVSTNAPHHPASEKSVTVGNRSSPVIAAAIAAAVALTPMMATAAASTTSPTAASAASVFAGQYIDPNHPHCPREIDAQGVITGIDPVPFVKGSGCRGYKKNEATAVEQGKIKPWRINAQIAADDASIFIDFDQKDGSGESFTGKWTGKGIEFPDGNVWTRKELSTIP